MMMFGANCEKVAQLVSESLDKKLPLYQRILLQMHLYACDTCQEFTKQIRVLHHMVHQLIHSFETDESLQLPQSVKQRYQDVSKQS